MVRGLLGAKRLARSGGGRPTAPLRLVSHSSARVKPTRRGCTLPVQPASGSGSVPLPVPNSAAAKASHECAPWVSDRLGTPQLPHPVDSHSARVWPLPHRVATIGSGRHISGARSVRPPAAPSSPFNEARPDPAGLGRFGFPGTCWFGDSELRTDLGDGRFARPSVDIARGAQLRREQASSPTVTS